MRKNIIVSVIIGLVLFASIALAANRFATNIQMADDTDVVYLDDLVTTSSGVSALITAPDLENFATTSSGVSAIVVDPDLADVTTTSSGVSALVTMSPVLDTLVTTSSGVSALITVPDLSLVRSDSGVSSIIVIQETDQFVRQGDTFLASNTFSGVTTAPDVLLRITTGTKTVKLKLAVTTVGTGTAVLYEGTTFSSPGSGVTMANLNDASSQTPLTVVYINPVINAAGTAVFPSPGGSGTGLLLLATDKNKALGAVGTDDNGFLLQAEHEYCLLIDNTSGTTNTITVIAKITEFD